MSSSTGVVTKVFGDPLGQRQADLGAPHGRGPRQQGEVLPVLVLQCLPAADCMNQATTSLTCSDPLCIDGDNACPPEDVGGPPGYADFLKAVAEPGHPEYEQYLTGCGGQFDPATFDLLAAKQHLSRIKL